MKRSDAHARVQNHIENGEFLANLKRLVAIPSVSQSEGDLETLYRYLRLEIEPLLSEIGFSTQIYDNPEKGAPPFLIASRIEDPTRPTILIYGHGDVCNGEAERWDNGLMPFSLAHEGDKLYGRGTADNKIQHLINFTALKLLIEQRRTLGFNVKIIMEMGEEMGSPGLKSFISAHRETLKADVLISSDGPRLRADHPTMFMGSRGAFDIAFTLHLRDNDYHSGNFGGILTDPVIRLCHALSSVTDEYGQIKIEKWRPTSLTNEIKKVLNDLPARKGDAGWGEQNLSSNERLFGWNSFSILAIAAGNITGPQSAISGSASAIAQLRFVVGTDPDEILPALREHLDQRGYHEVTVSKYAETLGATRFSLDHPWVQFVCDSITSSIGVRPDTLPNLAGSLPNDIFTDTLNLPTIWIPHSYAECGQHGPNEHAKLSLAREGLKIMTDLFLDLGQKPTAQA